MVGDRTVWVLRESFSLTQRRITSVMSSSGNCKRVRSSQTSASSIGDRLIIRRLGVCVKTNEGFPGPSAGFSTPLEVSGKSHN
jgi:hypothetical protein